MQNIYKHSSLIYTHELICPYGISVAFEGHIYINKYLQIAFYRILRNYSLGKLLACQF